MPRVSTRGEKWGGELFPFPLSKDRGYSFRENEKEEIIKDIGNSFRGNEKEEIIKDIGYSFRRNEKINYQLRVLTHEKKRNK